MDNRTAKLKTAITKLESTIWQMKQQIDDAIFADWKEMEGKYYLVETFPANGKVHFIVYHIISVEKELLVYKYGELEDGYCATHRLKSFGEPGYKSWTEISKEEFNQKIKGLQDLDKEKKNEGVKDDGRF